MATKKEGLKANGKLKKDFATAKTETLLKQNPLQPRRKKLLPNAKSSF